MILTICHFALAAYALWGAYQYGRLAERQSQFSARQGETNPAGRTKE